MELNTNQSNAKSGLANFADIYSKIVPITQLIGEVERIWEDRYKISKEHIDFIRDETMEPYFSELRKDLFCIIEHPYVDKMYRDTYYHFYSSKLLPYHRDSIRISFFDKAVALTDFLDDAKKEAAGKHYLGFLTLRPTFPNVIGRTALSPKAKTNNEIVCCQAKVNSTVRYVKYKVSCFPHAAQDNETISCAETTIWSLLEYFGNKYPEYKPILPSSIHKILHGFSFKRQMPSEGLTAEQVTYAVRELGFGAMIYSQSKRTDFDAIISMYIESGIPVVGILSDGKIGHAVNIIGRETDTPQNVAKWKANKRLDSEHGKINIIDYNEIQRKYVFIDDNHVPYQLARLNKPFRDYYKEPKYHACKLTNIVVPLYSKIYLEAAKARHNFFQYLGDKRFGIKNDAPRVVKMFLASSRSYKEYLALNQELAKEIKDLFLDLTMPKFIWVAEISNKKSFEKGYCEWIILQDGTEPLTYSGKAFGGSLTLIVGLVDNVYFTQNFGEFKELDIAKIGTFARPFKNYCGNLK